MLDMNFSLSTSGEEGLTLLRQVKLFVPQTPVILMTAWGSIQLAVQGMQAGAFDFITKPWNNLAMLSSVKTALQVNAPTDNSDNSTSQLSFDKIIGESAKLKEVLSTVARIAPTKASVLIMGESGTGKELIAEALHRLSPRASEPFVKVNLGGLSQSLFESEMFGHKKGAFTDAYADRVGRFEMADKGTIFLDEIGELDAACQVKLLRVLQDQTYEVLGDSRQRRADVRVVSATNRDLKAEVAAKNFREDLFYRINLITVTLPPLRERSEDIPLLVKHFIREQALSYGMQTAEVSHEAMTYLQRLPFYGNIRELRNLVERTVLVSGKECLDVEDFKACSEPTDASADNHTSNASTLDDMECQHITRALEKHNGNISRVANELGLSRAALYRRMEKYGIKQ
jgi:two-component system NtrC family response regulator